jgi:EpsI family protein
MTRRIWIAALLMTIGAGVVAWLSRAEVHASRRPFLELPLDFDGWAGRENTPFDAKVLRILGVDDHINRTYAQGGIPISLYVGYYESQRTGDVIHSPMKCLPGTGWQPLSTARVKIPLPPGSTSSHITVNRYVVQRNLDTYLVFFWYQGRGRVTPSEYAAKLQLMTDAVRINRTDGGLVRMIVPLGEGVSERRADEAAGNFIRALFPLLPGYLPS